MKHLLLLNFAAAHCIAGTEMVQSYFRLDSIRLGEHNISTERDCQEIDCADPVVNIPIAEVIVHENYIASAHHDDIALIRLARPVKFTKYITPICLPVSKNLRSKNLDNETMIVAGFGRTGLCTIK